MADFYRAEKLNDRMTAVISLTGEIMYLISGEKKSVLIDTCVGAGNLRARLNAARKAVDAAGNKIIPKEENHEHS